MRARKIGILFLTLIFPVALAACAGRGPSAVVERFATRVARGDVDAALPMLSTQVQGMLGEPKLRMVLSQGAAQARARGGFRGIDILSERISDDRRTAVVQTRTRYGSGRTESTEFNLVHEPDGWKIHMDAADK